MDMAKAPVPGQRIDKDYAYGQYSEEYYRKLMGNERRRSHRWRLKWVEQYLDPKPGDKIVDLGCGAGMVTRFLAQKGAACHGVDLSSQAIEMAKAANRDYPQNTFHAGDASRCDHLESASFDKAISADVIEHCGYDVMLDIFAEAHRLLKPGGLYYLYTPNPRHWIERLKVWGILKSDPTHTGLRPREPILDGLKQKGFEILAVPQPTSMFPVIKWFEKLWQLQPLGRELAVYRIAVLARKMQA